jgi:hypothetical protein
MLPTLSQTRQSRRRHLAREVPNERRRWTRWSRKDDVQLQFQPGVSQDRKLVHHVEYGKIPFLSSAPLEVGVECSRLRKHFQIQKKGLLPHLKCDSVRASTRRYVWQDLQCKSARSGQNTQGHTNRYIRPELESQLFVETVGLCQSLPAVGQIGFQLEDSCVLSPSIIKGCHGTYGAAGLQYPVDALYHTSLGQSLNRVIRV